MKLLAVVLLVTMMSMPAVRVVADTLSEEQIQQFLTKLSEDIKIDALIANTYFSAAVHISRGVRILELLRTSQSTQDPNVKWAIEALELELDGELALFTTYPEAEKSPRLHASIIPSLTQAKEYRDRFPRKHTHDNVRKAIDEVFQYAEVEGRTPRPAQQPPGDDSSPRADAGIETPQE